MQTKWTQCSPNYYNFRYTYGTELEIDYNSKQERGSHVALDFTITKLGQRDVQVTLTGTVPSEFDKDKHGSLQSLQNEGEKGKFFFVLDHCVSKRCLDSVPKKLNKIRSKISVDPIFILIPISICW